MTPGGIKDPLYNSSYSLVRVLDKGNIIIDIKCVELVSENTFTTSCVAIIYLFVTNSHERCHLETRRLVFKDGGVSAPLSLRKV